MKALFSAAAIAALFVGAPSTANTPNETNVFTFGIVPQQSASRLAKMWGPFLAELGARNGVTFRFQTAKDIPTFEACLAAGAYDFAYMNPMHYAIFSEEAGYQAFARQAKKRLKGIIVARKGTDLSDLEGLEDSQIAFPSPGAFGASILTRATLTDLGIDFEPAYVNSHDSVYRAVASGLMPAGGGVTRTFGAVDPEIRDQLTVIHETEAYTPHAFAFSATVEASFAEQVQASFVDLSETQPALVSGIGMSGLMASTNSDWDDVRALGMPRDASGILAEGQLECPSA